jgi:uncharacterized membrane protein YqhA
MGLNLYVVVVNELTFFLSNNFVKTPIIEWIESVTFKTLLKTKILKILIKILNIQIFKVFLFVLQQAISS